MPKKDGESFKKESAADTDGTVWKVEVKTDDSPWIVAAGTESWSYD